MAFEGEGERVRVEFDRIVFTEVRATDRGRYEVRARNRAGEGSSQTVLKGMIYSKGNCSIRAIDSAYRRKGRAIITHA